MACTIIIASICLPLVFQAGSLHATTVGSGARFTTSAGAQVYVAGSGDHLIPRDHARPRQVCRGAACAAYRRTCRSVEGGISCSYLIYPGRQVWQSTVSISAVDERVERQTRAQLTVRTPEGDLPGALFR